MSNATTAAAPSAEESRALLRAEFPGWRFILSDRRRWWALRGPLPRDRIYEVDCVDADTVEDLRAELAKIT